MQQARHAGQHVRRQVLRLAALWQGKGWRQGAGCWASCGALRSGLSSILNSGRQAMRLHELPSSQHGQSDEPARCARPATAAARLGRARCRGAHLQLDAQPRKLLPLGVRQVCLHRHQGLGRRDDVRLAALPARAAAHHRAMQLRAAWQLLGQQRGQHRPVLRLTHLFLHRPQGKGLPRALALAQRHHRHVCGHERMGACEHLGSHLWQGGRLQ